MRNLLLATILTACAVEPSTSSKASEARCQTCTVDPTEASTEWVTANYPAARITSISCSRGTNGWACSIEFENDEGETLEIGCTLWDDGALDCYVVGPGEG